MDVMELVENEQNARPFQCDWKTCTKVRTTNAMNTTSADSKRRALTENLTFSVTIAYIQMRDLTHV